jgi:hypothetical protein
MKNLLLSTVAALAITTTLGADEISDLKAQLKILSDRISAMEAKPQTSTTNTATDARISALEESNKKHVEQTDALTSELINVQNQTSFTAVDPSKSIQGLGAAASKVYYSKNPLSIGGYGELFYSKINDSVGTGSRAGVSANRAKDDFGDTYRFIPYIGYKFSDNIILNSEIEFEHGNEVWIEQLYVDFILDKMATVRVGDQIVPMGYTNLYHEPTLFNTVQRPDVERLLIPSTWHELGVSVYGQTDNFWYQVGVVAALDMNHPTSGAYGTIGSTTAPQNWIRKARVGAESDQGIDNIAMVARLDYNGINGLQIGVSGYTGKAGNATVSGAEEGRITMYDIHAVYQNEGFKARALYTETHLSNAGSYDTNTSDTTYVPTSARGGYVNLEYNILPLFTTSTDRMPIFFQYENYNLATKTTGDRSFGTTTSYTYGLNYFPHDQVVLKAEYMLRHNKNTATRSSDINEGIYSLGLGFIF